MYFEILKNNSILIDLKVIFPIKPSDFKISLSVEIYENKLSKTDEISTMLKCVHSFQTIIYIDPKMWYNNERTWMKTVYKFQVRICNTVWDMSRQRASWSGRVNFINGLKIDLSTIPI